MKPNNPQPAAFTLTELLVMLAVIAFSAATLVAALSQTGGKGRTMRCLSNVRRLALASQMYVNEHDDYLPTGGRIGLGDLGVRLAPYLGITLATNVTGYDDLGRLYWANPVFSCPAQRFRPNMGYGVNTIDFGFFVTNRYYQAAVSTKLSAVPQPHSGVALFVELAQGRDFLHAAIWREWSTTFDWRGFPNSEPFMIYYTDARHDGYTTVSFMDSHVEVRALTRQELPLRLLNPLDTR